MNFFKISIPILFIFHSSCTEDYENEHLETFNNEIIFSDLNVERIDQIQLKSHQELERPESHLYKPSSAVV